jgi:Immunity protein Imm1
MTLGWLRLFDTDSAYAPRRVEVMRAVGSGDRRDYLWVRLDPPLAAGEAGNEEIELVLLAPRHEGHPLAAPLDEPVHVYVCTVRGATTDVPAQIEPGDVEIRHWGILDPAEDRHWRLEWGEDGSAAVDSVETLDRLLEELDEQARERPFMAELISPARDSLALGLGREQFQYRGAWSEFPRWSAVPAVTARQAMRDFLQSAQLPSVLEWEEV